MIEESIRMSRRAEDMRHIFDRGFAEVRHVDARDTCDCLSVEIAGDPYMLRLSQIVGFVANKKVTRLPGGMPELNGIAGFRGVVMPIYDLAALLDYPPTRSTRWTVIAADEPVGLGFDGFNGHFRFATDEIVPREGADEADPLGHVVRSGRLALPVVSIPSIVARIRQRAAVAGSTQEH